MISRLFPKSSHLRLTSILFIKSPSTSVPHGTSSSNFTLRSSFSSSGGGKYAAFKWKRLSEVESEAYSSSDLVVEAQKTAMRDCALLTIRKYGKIKLLMDIESRTLEDSMKRSLVISDES